MIWGHSFDHQERINFCRNIDLINPNSNLRFYPYVKNFSPATWATDIFPEEIAYATLFKSSFDHFCQLSFLLTNHIFMIWSCRQDFLNTFLKEKCHVFCAI